MNFNTAQVDIATAPSLPLTGDYSPKRLIESLSSLPPSWWLIPVIEKRAYTTKWQNTSDPETKWEIDALGLEIKRGSANGIGIVTGKPQNLIAIDIDGISAERLIESISELSLDEALPTTVSFASGRPGRRQLLYLIPAGALTNPDFTKKVVTKHNTVEASKEEQLEFRFNKQQSVLPPSLHPETGCYYWLVEPTVDGSNVTIAPDWLIRYLNSLNESQQDKPIKTDTNLDPNFVKETKEQEVEASEKEDTIVEAARVIARANIRRVLEAGKGTRMTTLNDMSFGCGGLIHTGVKTSWLKEELFNAARENGLVSEEGEKKIYATINTALNKGKQEPLKVTPRAKQSSKQFTMSALKEFYEPHLKLNTLTNEIWYKDKLLANMMEIFEGLTYIFDFNFNQGFVESYTAYLAEKATFSPVVDYLNSRIWDGQDRVGSLAKTLFKSDDPWHQIYLERWFIGTVARPLNPGCEMHTCLILSGGQGIGKTSFFKILGGDGYTNYSNDNSSGKDGAMLLAGGWIVEMAELDAIFGKKEWGEVKSLITNNKDKYRPPYGKVPVTHLRACVIVGTTNEAEFLGDPTGSRRFAVIPMTQSIDLEWLTKNRDQLWAEAVHKYKNGEQYHYTQEENQEITNRNHQFDLTDPWEEGFMDVCVGIIDHSTPPLFKRRQLAKLGTNKSYVTMPEVLVGLGFCLGKQTKREQYRVKKIFNKLGFTQAEGNKQVRDPDTGKQVRPWYFPPALSFDDLLLGAECPTPSEPPSSSTYRKEFPIHGEADNSPDSDVIAYWKKDTGQT